MRQSVAIALLFGVGAGCSLIYNPSNLGQPTDSKIFNDAAVDAPPDVEMIADANPADLMISEIYPGSIDEGRGSNGSTPGLFVIRGSNFENGSAAGLTVSLTPMGSATPPLSFTTTISSDHNFIALQMIAAVDRSCPEGSAYSYTVGVIQNGATLQTLTKPFVENCHAELGSGAAGGSATLVIGATPPAMYSEVDVGGSLTITGAGSAIIQSASTIEVDGPITANASGQTAGPGGFPGGAAGDDGGGPGGGAGGIGVGAGAGFVTAGTSSGGAGKGGGTSGDTAITTYTTNVSSGGGGCTLCDIIGGNHAGGGGGGTVELTAHGDITVGSIAANGGNAAASSTGDGTGGVIVVRAVGATVHGAVTLAVSPGNAGYAASPGRTRVDGLTDIAISAAYYGPGIQPTPPVSLTQNPPVMFTGTPIAQYNGYVRTRDGEFHKFTVTGGADSGNGYGPDTENVPLTSGYNLVCVLTGGVALAQTELDIAQNCIEMAFLP
jgi:hypothetical protein